MTKIKRSITISLELDNVLSRLASRLDQNTSELIEFRLREDPQIKEMLQRLRSASDPPQFKKTKTILH
jgi:hypothetical protein